MASTIGSTQRNWTEKIERLFKQPNRRSMHCGAPSTNLPHARSYPPSDLWRSVFYHTITREIQAGDNRGRRLLRIDFPGLDVITTYEYPSTHTAEAELTPAQIFGHLPGDGDGEWIPGLSLEETADRVLAKVIHIASTACTSFVIGTVMQASLLEQKFRSRIFNHLRRDPVLLCDLQTDPEYRYFSVFRPSIPLISGTPSTMDTVRAFSGILLVSELADGLKKVPASVRHSCPRIGHCTKVVPRTSPRKMKRDATALRCISLENPLFQSPAIKSSGTRYLSKTIPTKASSSPPPNNRTVRFSSPVPLRTSQASSTGPLTAALAPAIQRLPLASTHLCFSLGDSVPCKAKALSSINTSQSAVAAPIKIAGLHQQPKARSRFSLANTNTSIAFAPSLGTRPPAQITTSQPAARRSLDVSALFWPSGTREPTVKEVKRHSMAPTPSAGTRGPIESVEMFSGGEKEKENAFRSRELSRGLIPRWKP